MKVIGVIPARYGSTRFPGKPLVSILGKPLLTWVIERSLQSKLISEVIVATDDTVIAELAKKSGVTAVMTDPDLPSGSDRVWAVVQNLACDIALSIQGDEPLIEASALDALVQSMIDHPEAEMATLGRPMTAEALESSSSAKILLNHLDEAIYFSRFPLPYSRGVQDLTRYISLKHVGIYAYRKAFLGRFCQQKPVPIELAEGLEQLRALYLGAKIKVVRTELESWGVDTPEDVIKVEAKLRSLGNKK